MISELDYLIAKHSSIAPILTKHKASLEIELGEVQSGVRKLTKNDFLGPKTRVKMMKEEAEVNECTQSKAHTSAIALE